MPLHGIIEAASREHYLFSWNSSPSNTRIPLLNYRAFEATIVLKSFRDRLIDMFDSKTLFTRLTLEAEKREMLKCGNALCFKKPISVKGSHCELLTLRNDCCLVLSTPFCLIFSPQPFCF
jgi:hypothetical protein